MSHSKKTRLYKIKKHNNAVNTIGLFVIPLLLVLSIVQIYSGMFANTEVFYLPQVGIGGGPESKPVDTMLPKRKFPTFTPSLTPAPDMNNISQ